MRKGGGFVRLRREAVVQLARVRGDKNGAPPDQGGDGVLLRRSSSTSHSAIPGEPVEERACSSDL